ncbi:hypothetical protein NQ315_004002 [Exocentrus adspersus]|uniref:Uncharacterized protein n=1 Tax=Exocentrus adspersus TaxID=1586481 RepID=A0AAV8VEE2_9CUCU|nr:hypothetical protein NQ315_004002 [Exocentrus adspersus]
MDALRPQDWDDLIQKMTNDPKLFELFYKYELYYYKASPVRPTCDMECKKRILCDLHSGRSHDRRNLCETIESRIDSTSGTSWKQWLYNTISVSMSVLMSIPRLTIQLPNREHRGITYKTNEDFQTVYDLREFRDASSFIDCASIDRELILSQVIVETDASDPVVRATLSQAERPNMLSERREELMGLNHMDKK